MRLERSVLRQMNKKITGIVSIFAGILLIGYGLSELIPELLAERDYKQLSDEVVTSSDSGIDVDFSDLDANAWIKLEGTNISYPVLQGSDNSYYLHHDADGNKSWTTVFADYRSDMNNGKNIVIYGHHLLSGGMFSPIATSNRQSEFDKLGYLYYNTPEGTKLKLKPLMAMSVDKTYEPIQRFEPELSYEEQKSVSDDVIRDIIRSDNQDISDTALEDLASSYKPTAEEQNMIDDEISRKSVQLWLEEMSKNAQACDYNITDRISKADRAVTLVACTSRNIGERWRTLLVCTAE